MKEPAVTHQSVLLTESMTFLAVRQGGFYLDATLGEGGHSRGILERGGRVLALDRDEEALIRGEDSLVGQGNYLALPGNFRQMGELVKSQGFDAFDGVLFDLGLSLWQLRGSGRGFSYLTDEPLDMRMNHRQKLTAEQVLNEFDRNQLRQILVRLGEERLSDRLVDLIEKHRSTGRIKTSGELSSLVGQLVGDPGQRRSVSARVFQALRIFVNDELEDLRQALPQALELLRIGGRLVVISFHSLEDRLVKNFFRRWEESGRVAILTPRPVRPSIVELSQNPASRSAKLRAISRVL